MSVAWMWNDRRYGKAGRVSSQIIYEAKQLSCACVCSGWLCLRLQVYRVQQMCLQRMDEVRANLSQSAKNIINV